jgi:tRNA G10  N-methylase Trm11
MINCSMVQLNVTFPKDILISIADLPPHSIILDPCAGIGTINIRASFQGHFGLGGEILPKLFEDHVPYFLECNKKFQQKLSRGAADMTGWDATMLPLREAFVDAVVSDIPFGMYCFCNMQFTC